MPRSLAVLLAAALVTGCGAPGTSSAPADPSSPLSDAPRPVVIDTDLDVSDMAAVAALLLDPRLDVLAVTVSATGTGITNCAAGRAVVEYLLSELDRADVPSACGRADAGSDAIPFPAEWRTAADTGWGIDMPARPRSEVPGTAADLLREVVSGAAMPPTLVPLGPWTNLEDALAADPSFFDGVAGIHGMAAALDALGNVFTEELGAEDRLEWNVAADPSAFVTVFATDVPIALVPLDATDDVPVAPDFADRLAASAAAGANLVHELFLRVPGRVGEGQQLWDELAALALVEDSLVTWEEMSLSVTPTGRLDRSEAGRPVRVATAADAAATESALLEALERGPDRERRFAVSGEVTIAWDGSSCEASSPDDLLAGPLALTLRNESDAPVAAAVLQVDAPHEWSEVEELLAEDVAIDGLEPPPWLHDRGFVVDEAGGGEVTSTLVTGAGLHGVVCLAGSWPDVGPKVGTTFEVAAGP
jgi:inosine-uridine nucleoside N-ribohydrolase